ncbi:MAG TPA: hypothetical protein VEZ14_01100 [Dehalococcoidia bacterium]|nr:hypothetical protein [Dehalococcoidia bacterium]
MLRALLVTGDFTITVSETTRCDTVQRLASDQADAAVVFITHGEHGAELRDMMEACPHVRFLLVAPMKPVRAAIARVVREFGGAITSIDDGPLIAVATLVSLIAQAKADAEVGR